jgi:hypothetical protein
MNTLILLFALAFVSSAIAGQLSKDDEDQVFGDYLVTICDIF